MLESQNLNFKGFILQKKFFMLIVSVVVALLFSACAEISTKSVLEDSRFKPKISINNVKIKSINLDSIILESNISIDNFLPLSVNIKDAMINIYYEDKIINSYKINDKSTLKARSTSKINLDSDIRINDLVKMIKDYTTRDSLPFKVEVATTIFVPNLAGDSTDSAQNASDSALDSAMQSPLGDLAQNLENLFEYNLRERFEFDIPTINPKLSLKEAKFGLGDSKVVVNVKNNTRAKFKLENIAYNLRLSGVDFSGDATSLPQDDESVDIVMDNFSFSLPKGGAGGNESRTSVDISANLQLGDLSYKIPLKLSKDFK